METEHKTQLEKLMTESLSYTARLAVYRNELPSEKLAPSLREIEQMVSRSTLTALIEASQTREKLLASQGISPEQLVKEKQKLSAMLETFANDMNDINVTLWNSMKTTAQQQQYAHTEINKQESVSEEVSSLFDKFKMIDVKVDPFKQMEQGKEETKDKKMGL